MVRNRFRSALVLCALTLAPVAARAAPAKKPPAEIDLGALKTLEWREVGPYRGGRSAAVAGVPSDRNLYYFGSTGGGVWKTEDAGRTWKNVSDGFFGGSIGAVAVSEWDPNVIYVGGGEKTVRGNVSHGDGMWKSTDAGRTWRKVGLDKARHIPRVRIHPRDPDLAYAAVLGDLYKSSPDRGVYRTKDGGKNWERILFANDDAGAVDLILDPTNPRILYASTWRVRRMPYTLESGGEGSKLWKSTDGGDTWTDLTANEGMPKGTLGIIGITVSPSNPDNLYAIVEAEEGGVFRSKDAGKTWTRTNQDRDLRQRAWYYTRIVADPKDAEQVYVLNVRFHKSKDGGRSFRTTIRVPHGDNHDLWIDPADPLRMVQSNDGGANVSFDGGQTWSVQSNQPTAQMYRVSADNAFPYRLLGGQQDNSALRIRSRSLEGGSIGPRDFEPTAGGESGHVVAKPDDPDVVYGGSYGGLLTMVNHRTGEVRAVNPWPNDPMGAGAGDQKYRFQWNFPILFSPHDADTLYAAANVLFRSTDGGASWEKISGDLTRNDPTKLGPSGGPITKDNTSVEYYGTIFAAAESPVEKGVLWAGSDDGRVHISRDAGKSWTEVTPRGLPEWTQVNSLDPSPHEAGSAYLAATSYKSGDFKPYLYRTSDFGKSWTKIVEGIDPNHFTRVVRADPGRKGLLYAGTERGVYVSFDDGAYWRPLQLNLPIVPVTDLLVKDGDLVVATQGRSYWILDDLSVLRQATAENTTKNHFFAPRPSLRVGGFRQDKPVNAGTNPYPGAGFYYLLAEEPKADATAKLEIVDAAGTVLRTYTRKPEGETKKEGEDEDEGEDLAVLPVKKGLNRFHWDLSTPPAERFPGLILWNDGLDGPRAIPGAYKAKLTVGDWTAEADFELKPDPRAAATAVDHRAQFDFVAGVRDKLTVTHQAIGEIRDAKGQIDGVTKRFKGLAEAEAVEKAGKELKDKLTAIEEVLYQTKNKSSQDPLNFPIRLNDKLAALLQLAQVGDFGPTAQMVEVRKELEAAIDAELTKLEAIWSTDLPAFNQLAKDKGAEPVMLKKK